MRVSDLRLDYLAGPGIEPRTVHVQSPKANAYRVKPSGQGVSTTGAALHDNNEASAKVTTQYGRR